MLHAGRVLRTFMMMRTPQMIADRKLHLRVYRRCMVGADMVDWLLQFPVLVGSRTQAVGMWQALVEEGVLVHGKKIVTAMNDWKFLTCIGFIA